MLNAARGSKRALPARPGTTPSIPPLIADLLLELWQRALAAEALLQVKHGPDAQALTTRTAEAQALREQLTQVRDQLARESLAYGELRTPGRPPRGDCPECAQPGHSSGHPGAQTPPRIGLRPPGARPVDRCASSAQEQEKTPALGSRSQTPRHTPPPEAHRPIQT